MGVRQLSDFKEGDRVRLIKHFRCQGDNLEYDADIDTNLRQRAEEAGTQQILGTVEYVSDYVEVMFDHGCDYGSDVLMTDPDVLDFEYPPLLEEEVEAAIRSIQEAQGG